jgi:hypothetical protein
MQRQPRAALEGIIADVLERGGQRQLRQPRAVLEGVVADICHLGEACASWPVIGVTQLFFDGYVPARAAKVQSLDYFLV